MAVQRQRGKARGMAAQASGAGEALSLPVSPGVLCVAVSLLALVAYSPVVGYDFVNLDDLDYVIGNGHVLAGLGWEGVVWAFHGSLSENYWQPLTWLSLMLDASLYGGWAGGYHLTNIVFHAANAALVLQVVRRLTGRLWAAAFVAACFAVHPAHQESVAWISERKDVLYLFFGLCSLLAYLRWVRTRRPLELLMASLGFALSLMAKPVLVALPFLLLLFDFWPLRRFARPEPGGCGPAETGGQGRVGISALLLEKLPLFALSVASCAVTLLTSLQDYENTTIGMGVRLANAVVSLLKYVWLLLAPAGLGVLYPLPNTVPLWQWTGAAVVLCLALALALRESRRLPWVLVCSGWMVAGLAPLLVSPPMGMQIGMANRSGYFAFIGGYLFLALGVEQLAARFAPGRVRPVMSLVLGAILAWYVVLFALELPAWRNSEALYSHALSGGHEHHVTLNNYGRIMLDSREYEKAEKLFRRSLDVRPNFSLAHGNLGTVAMRQGRYGEAIGHFQRSIQTSTGAAFLKDDHYGIGYCLAQLGRLDEAEAHYRKALELKPDYAMAHNDLGNIALLRGDLREAEKRYSKALESAPDYTVARENLARTRARLAASAQGGG